MPVARNLACRKKVFRQMWSSEPHAHGRFQSALVCEMSGLQTCPAPCRATPWHAATTYPEIHTVLARLAGISHIVVGLVADQMTCSHTHGSCSTFQPTYGKASSSWGFSRTSCPVYPCPDTFHDPLAKIWPRQAPTSCTRLDFSRDIKVC
jgi:hypothetical protein